MGPTSPDHIQPRNAAELAYLSKATPSAPTLAYRAQRLAELHAMGHTLPDTDAGPEAVAAWAAWAAWAAREALAAAALRPPALKKPKPAPAAKPASVPLPTPTQAPALPAKTYAQRLGDALASGRLTPKAAEGVRSELAKLGG